MINKKLIIFASIIINASSIFLFSEEIQKKIEVDSKPQLFILDSIKGIVFTDGTSEVITQSDLMRPDISGVVKPFEEQIKEKLIYTDAKRFKLTPGDEEVEKYFNTIAKENNLKPDDFEKIAASAGLTLRELKEKLKTVQAINGMLDFKIRQNLIIPRKEIEAYYHSHPEFLEASYEIAYAFVPFDFQDKKILQNKIMRSIATGTGMKVQFSDPFTLKKSEIAPEKDFITRLAIGKVSRPRENQNGFEIFKMINKKPERLRTLEERSKEIVEILRTPKFNQLLEDYTKELMQNACILEFANPN